MKQGFTLVEILVAVSILLILIILFGQLFTGVSTVIIRQSHQLSSSSDFRQAANRFGFDWHSRVRHKYVDWSVVNPGSQTISIRLLSEVDGLGGTRGLASVAYQINTTSFSLERGTVGYGWLPTGTSPVLAFTSPSTLVIPPSPPQANFETLAPTIFRMCLSYLNAKTGKWTVTPTISLQDENLAAIAVTMAALDPESRAILSYGQMQALSAKLTDPTGEMDPKMVWVDKLNSPGFAATAGIPTRAAAAVSIEQKVFSTKN